MKSIVHVSRPLPGGWSTTGVSGSKDSLRLTGLAMLMVNVVPSQAVPSAPVPLGLSANTSRSGRRQSPGPTGRGLPQDGVSEMAGTPGKRTSSSTGAASSGGVETLVMVIEAGTPVSPTATAAGKVGVTSSRTAA